jgi:hypothetical protein
VNRHLAAADVSNYAPRRRDVGDGTSVVVGDDGYRLSPLRFSPRSPGDEEIGCTACEIVFYGSSSEGSCRPVGPSLDCQWDDQRPNKFSKSTLADPVVGDGTVGIFSPFCPSPTTPWPVSGIRQRVDSSLVIREFFFCMFQAAQHEQCVNRYDHDPMSQSMR